MTDKDDEDDAGLHGLLSQADKTHVPGAGSNTAVLNRGCVSGQSWPQQLATPTSSGWRSPVHSLLRLASDSSGHFPLLELGLYPMRAHCAAKLGRRMAWYSGFAQVEAQMLASPGGGHQSV